MSKLKEAKYFAGSCGVESATYGWWDNIERAIPSRDFTVQLKEKDTGRLLLSKEFCNCKHGEDEAVDWIIQQAKDYARWK